MIILRQKLVKAGDDTKIGLKLKKDLNVTTVTAADTVKAGTVIMGKQSGGAGGTNGNFVTGSIISLGTRIILRL